MSEHNKDSRKEEEEERIYSLEDADNRESNRQLLWTLVALLLGFVMILIIYL